MPRVKIKNFGWAANRNQPQHRLKFVIKKIYIIYYYYYFTNKQNGCPEPEPGCDFEAVEEAKELWKTLKASAQSTQVFTIQMEQIAPFGE